MPGIFLLAGMGLQFPAGSIQISFGDASAEMAPIMPLVRLDLWLPWLEIGCTHADQAHRAASTLSPGVSDDRKYAGLTDELQAGLVAFTALAFAVDAFYDTVRHEMGNHPDRAAWATNRTARHRQIAETLRFHLKLGPTSTKQLKDVLRQLYAFRDRAVHASSTYIAPNFRPEIDAGVHPHLLTFSGPHVVQVRALVLEILSQAVQRALDIARGDVDIEWLQRARGELYRLSLEYRVPGDDVVAYPVKPS